MPLPTGTVTFLFTDIQGSATLAQQHPAELPALLARHHAILHEAIAHHDGHVFKIIGDAFCAAFSTAGDALAAALEAQRALQDEPWTPAPVAVRMGLHTGAATADAGDYTGHVTLTRVQRVMSAAYGGQVLVSATTAELLRGHLPEDVALRDLGEHRLKSLLSPEHLWQMVAPGLRQEFPPLPTLNAIPNNLPVQLTSFIGRQQEIAEVSKRLTTTHLLTLTGAGGAGKTRLSLEVAAEVLDTFKHGVWFVELALLTDPGLIPGTVVGVLGLREAQSRPLMETLLGYLENKQLLLILDNCEHLIEGCARFADAILHAGRQVRILASSREALGIAGEQTWRVPSLATPDPEAVLPAEQIEQYAAVQLFIARARAVRSDFRVTDANAPAVAQVCWRLDGIPLAIELAAARVRAMPVEQISARLDDRFRLLTGGGRTALPRHQTLRAALDWSWGLLSDVEQVLFRRLAVFAGGWTLEAAETVCADGKLDAGSWKLDARSSSAPRGSAPPVASQPETAVADRLRAVDEDPLLDAWDVLDLLCRLVDKSLVTLDSEGGKERYRMLETIREYALEKLREVGEEEAVRDRHQCTYLVLALSLEGQPIEEVPRLMLSLEVEHDNLRAVLGWLLEREDSEPALALCNVLIYLWSGRYFSEGRTWFRRVIAASRRLQASQQVSQSHRSAYGAALDAYGTIAIWQGDYELGREALQEALAVERELDNKAGVASVLISLGMLAWYQDDAQTARAVWEECLRLYREVDPELGDRGQSPYVLSLLAQLARERGDYGESEILSRESLTLARELGSQNLIASALIALGWLAMIAGDYRASQMYEEESMALRQELGFEVGVAWCFTQRGYLAWHLGDCTAARAAFRQALTLFWKQEASSFDTCPCLTGCAAVDVSEGDLERGVSLLGAIAAECERTGRSNKDIFLRVYEQSLAAARAGMDPPAFDAAWAAGRALTMAQAMEMASQTRRRD